MQMRSRALTALAVRFAAVAATAASSTADGGGGATGEVEADSEKEDDDGCHVQPGGKRKACGEAENTRARKTNVPAVKTRSDRWPRYFRIVRNRARERGSVNAVAVAAAAGAAAGAIHEVNDDKSDSDDTTAVPAVAAAAAAVGADTGIIADILDEYTVRQNIFEALLDKCFNNKFPPPPQTDDVTVKVAWIQNLRRQNSMEFLWPKKESDPAYCLRFLQTYDLNELKAAGGTPGDIIAFLAILAILPSKLVYEIRVVFAAFELYCVMLFFSWVHHIDLNAHVTLEKPRRMNADLPKFVPAVTPLDISVIYETIPSHLCDSVCMVMAILMDTHNLLRLDLVNTESTVLEAKGEPGPTGPTPASHLFVSKVCDLWHYPLLAPYRVGFMTRALNIVGESAFQRSVFLHGSANATTTWSCFGGSITGSPDFETVLQRVGWTKSGDFLYPPFQGTLSAAQQTLNTLSLDRQHESTVEIPLVIRQLTNLLPDLCGLVEAYRVIPGPCGPRGALATLSKGPDAWTRAEAQRVFQRDIFQATTGTDSPLELFNDLCRHMWNMTSFLRYRGSFASTVYHSMDKESKEREQLQRRCIVAFWAQPVCDDLKLIAPMWQVANHQRFLSSFVPMEHRFGYVVNVIRYIEASPNLLAVARRPVLGGFIASDEVSVAVKDAIVAGVPADMRDVFRVLVSMVWAFQHVGTNEPPSW